MANEEVTQIEKLGQWHLNDFLQLLTYQIDKAEVDDEEYRYQEIKRKAKRGK